VLSHTALLMQANKQCLQLPKSLANNSISQSRYLLFEFLIGNGYTPKNIFDQAIVDFFKSAKSSLPSITSNIIAVCCG
jgi:hypothetical protein